MRPRRGVGGIVLLVSTCSKEFERPTWNHLYSQCLRSAGDSAAKSRTQRASAETRSSRKFARRASEGQGTKVSCIRRRLRLAGDSAAKCGKQRAGAGPRSFAEVLRGRHPRTTGPKQTSRDRRNEEQGASGQRLRSGPKNVHYWSATYSAESDVRRAIEQAISVLRKPNADRRIVLSAFCASQPKGASDLRFSVSRWNKETVERVSCFHRLTQKPARRSRIRAFSGSQNLQQRPGLGGPGTGAARSEAVLGGASVRLGT